MGIVDRLGGYRSGLAQKAPCYVATTGNITLSGYQVVDGVTLSALDENPRVLVKTQTDARENGVYISSSGLWQRAVDFNGNNDFIRGTRVNVHSGASQTGAWVVTSADPMVVGDDDIDFTAAAVTDNNFGALATLALMDDEADFAYVFDTSAGLNKKVLGKNLGFTPAGTGADLRSLQSKLRESVSVQDFGAVGDGVTDDTAEFAAALAAHQTVYVPPTASGYVIDTLNINIAGRRLISDGAKIIHKATAASHCLRANADNVVIEGLEVDQSLQTIGHSGIVLGAFNNITIRNNYLHDGPFIAILASFSTYALIENNTVVDFMTTGAAGINLDGNTNSSAIGNRVTNTGAANIAFSGSHNAIIGNQLENSGNADNVTGYGGGNSDWIIMGNTCRDSHNHGIHVAGYRGKIIGNNIYNCATRGINILANDSPNPSEDIVISGNTVDGAPFAGITISETNRLTLANNIVRSSGQQGINTQTCTDFAITGNVITDSGNTALRIADPTRGTVSGNSISGSPSFGIDLLEVVTPPSGVNVIGNLVSSCAASIRAGSNTTNSQIRSNILIGNTTNAVSAPSAVIVGDNITDAFTGTRAISDTVGGGAAAGTNIVRWSSGLFAPVSAGGATWGSASLPWGNGFLNAATFLDWGNNDVRITHSTNALAFTGASSGYSFDAQVTGVTASSLDNSTKFATTAYVDKADGEVADINPQTDNYTLILTDKGKIIEINAATGKTLTIPTNASVAFPLKTRIDIVQMGAGQITIAGAGVTIRSADSKLKLFGQYSGASLYKRATDEWVLIGDLAA